MEYFFSFDKIAYLKGKKPEGCILCLIESGSEEVERLVVHETASFIVSLNLYPYNPGHLIIFPRRHVLDIREYREEEARELDALLRLSLAALDAAYGPSGYNIGYNMGLAAGASIEHLHLHLIPRFPRELGIAELIAGKRVLVRDPRDSLEDLRRAFAEAARA